MSHLGESPGILVQIASREKPDNNLQKSAHNVEVRVGNRKQKNTEKITRSHRKISMIGLLRNAFDFVVQISRRSIYVLWWR